MGKGSIFALIAAGVGAGIYMHMLDKREFNRLAEGLTAEQRALAQKFWKGASRQRSEEYAKYAAAMAKLEHVEAARVALDRLDKPLSLWRDPTCDRQVALWLTEHWMREAALALHGEVTLSLKMLVRTDLDAELAEIQQEVLRHMGELGVDDGS